MPGGRPAVSVVVMGYRNADTILRAVGSVVTQADDDVEIVVVTSGGDDSAAFVRGSHPALTVIESPTRLLPGGARNVGVAASRGAIVAFLAADCVAEPGWVANRRRRHDEGHPVVASAVTNGTRRSPAAWGFHFGIYRDRLEGIHEGNVSGSSPSAHGCSFERTVLAELGPFDDTVEFGEDTDASCSLDRLGVPVWYEPSVRTAHFGPGSMIDLLRDRYRRGALRGRTLGPVSRNWYVVARIWVATLRRARVIWRDARPDRIWVVVSFPWLLAGEGAHLLGHQLAARRASRAAATSARASS